jgi:hypothetical protein
VPVSPRPRPRALAELAARCAEADPALRFPDAAALTEALARVADGLD